MIAYPNFLKAVAILFWLGAGVHLACAEPRPVDSIEAVLKDIKPGKPCASNQPAKPKPVNNVNSPTTPKPGMACAMLPDEVVQLSKASEALLVDTRSQSDYAAYHIDGAVNISPVELQGKPFLKDKNIVLVGNGKAEQQLYIECRRLKAAGFKRASVLRGGMPVWLSSGHGILGQVPALDQLITLSPAELWQESHFKPNLVFIGPNQKPLHKQIKGSSLIDIQDPKIIQAQIKQHTKRSNLQSISAVVLVTGKDLDLYALSREIKPVPLLVYSDTVAAYNHYLAQQPAVWTAYANGPKQPAGCRR